MYSAKVTNEYVDLLKKTKSIIEENNSKMYFVYCHHKKYQKSFLRRNIWTKLRGPIENHSFNSYKDIINLVKSLDIPLIDLHEELFKSMEDPMSVVPEAMVILMNKVTIWLQKQFLIE